MMLKRQSQREAGRMVTSRSYYCLETDGGGKHAGIWEIQVREKNRKFSLYQSYLLLSPCRNQLSISWLGPYGKVG